jgi:hypothetical protein
MTDGKPRKGNLMQRIRSELRQRPDGLVALTLSNLTGSDKSTVYYSLNRMPDAYIDRWEESKEQRGPRYVAVWCVVVPPENCPKPN